MCILADSEFRGWSIWDQLLTLPHGCVGNRVSAATLCLNQGNPFSPFVFFCLVVWFVLAMPPYLPGAVNHSPYHSQRSVVAAPSAYLPGQCQWSPAMTGCLFSFSSDRHPDGSYSHSYHSQPYESNAHQLFWEECAKKDTF